MINEENTNIYEYFQYDDIEIKFRQLTIEDIEKYTKNDMIDWIEDAKVGDWIVDTKTTLRSQTYYQILVDLGFDDIPILEILKRLNNE